MVTFFLFFTVGFSVSFGRGATNNLFLDPRAIADAFFELNARLSHYNIDSPWGYEFYFSGSKFDVNKAQDFANMGGGISYFKDFGKAGDYFEIGINSNWDFYSPYPAIFLSPFLSGKLYLSSVIVLNANYTYSFLNAEYTQYHEQTPAVSMNFGTPWGTFNMHGKFDWRYSSTFVLDSAGSGHGNLWSNRIVDEERLLEAGDVSLRYAVNIINWLGLFYEVGFHFAPSSNAVYIEDLKEITRPDFEEKYAFSGIVHNTGVNFYTGRFIFNYVFGYESRDFHIVDSNGIYIERDDVLTTHNVNMKILIIDSKIQMGLYGGVNIMKNNSTTADFTFDSREFRVGLFMSL